MSKTARPNGTTMTLAPPPEAPKPIMAHVPEVKDGTVIAVPQDAGDEMFDQIANSGKYLPRLQMFGSKSDAVGAGKIGMAHFGLVTGKDNIQDLGEEVQIVPVYWRPKALDTSGE